jgi:hypothetical protein
LHPPRPPHAFRAIWKERPSSQLFAAVRPVPRFGPLRWAARSERRFTPHPHPRNATHSEDGDRHRELRPRLDADGHGEAAATRARTTSKRTASTQMYLNEIDPFCCAVLRKNFPEAQVDERDIRDVQPADLTHEQCHFFAGIGGFPLGLAWANWEGPIWTGGFPCQDISVAGKGAGLEGTRSGLWWEWHRLIAECRPPLLLIENVPALRVRGADQVLSALEELGYACGAFVVGAEHVGAPHKRLRAFLVAHCNSEGPQVYASQPGDSRPQLQAPERSRWPSRPSEPQHEWEAPRLAYSQGREASVSGQSREGSAAGKSLGRLGNSVAGVSGRVAGRRREKLKSLGNAVVPQVVQAIAASLLALRK